jgi:hypothetical protein
MAPHMIRAKSQEKATWNMTLACRASSVVQVHAYLMDATGCISRNTGVSNPKIHRRTVRTRIGCTLLLNPPCGTILHASREVCKQRKKWHCATQQASMVKAPCLDTYRCPETIAWT